MAGVVKRVQTGVFLKQAGKILLAEKTAAAGTRNIFNDQTDPIAFTDFSKPVNPFHASGSQALFLPLLQLPAAPAVSMNHVMRTGKPVIEVKWLRKIVKQLIVRYLTIHMVKIKRRMNAE